MNWWLAVFMFINWISRGNLRRVAREEVSAEIMHEIDPLLMEYFNAGAHREYDGIKIARDCVVKIGFPNVWEREHNPDKQGFNRYR